MPIKIQTDMSTGWGHISLVLSQDMRTGNINLGETDLHTKYRERCAFSNSLQPLFSREHDSGIEGAIFLLNTENRLK